ncbi:MAG: hypothetical protein K2O69_04065 [Odoribacter sp.]|nr:hypothetical protein [Odoribacter sp.]
MVTKITNVKALIELFNKMFLQIQSLNSIFVTEWQPKKIDAFEKTDFTGTAGKQLFSIQEQFIP